jgi:hypothetical protein
MDKSLVQIVADNVKAAREFRKIDSYRALASKAKVAANSVKNLEAPEQRAATKRGSTSPRMDVLDKVATALGFQSWHMLLEDFDPTNPPPLKPPTEREVKAWRKIEQAYRELDKSDFDGNSRE